MELIRTMDSNRFDIKFSMKLIKNVHSKKWIRCKVFDGIDLNNGFEEMESM